MIFLEWFLISLIVLFLFLIACRFPPLKTLLIWFAFDGPIKSGKLSAYLLGLAIGRMPKKVKGPNK